jgi:hypothetical protein
VSLKTRGKNRTRAFAEWEARKKKYKVEEIVAVTSRFLVKDNSSLRLRCQEDEETVWKKARREQQLKLSH